ncbi:MarR family transcriptional regulator, partial [Desulfococcaceae bacterium HSG8]|nr:MarR family transcriptional regulator [Desulfococcaceae bacterium HSG8]
EQAFYIMETGKLIHDRVSRVFAGHAARDRKKKELYELSISQLYAVKATRNKGEVTITELSELLNVSPPSASAMVDRLVEKGILTRERSAKDRRKVVVSVSPEAIESIEKVEKKILNSFICLIQKIGPETAHNWCEVLARVKEVLEGER